MIHQKAKLKLELFDILLHLYADFDVAEIAIVIKSNRLD